MLRVGLTGGIASGKSHVATRLARAGFQTIDLDRVGHDVIARGGAAYADVVAAFGPGILRADGAIDRKALGRIVFADAAARARLNAIVHPRIWDEEARLVAVANRTKGGVLVVEAALLVEAGQHLRFDRLVVAHCGAAEQRRRLMRRDGLDDATAEARLRAQMPPEDKRRFAHVVVDTSGSVAVTDRGTDRVAAELAALAGGVRIGRVDASLAAALVSGATGLGPGGLTIAALLEEMAAGLDLDRLSRRLFPLRVHAWYVPAADPEPGPEVFAGPAALYGLLRRGDDREYTAGVAYSLACLTHVSAAARSRAVVSALACQAAALGSAADSVFPQASRLAERFTGHAPEPETCVAAAAHATALATSTPALSAVEGEILEGLLRAAL